MEHALVDVKFWVRVVVSHNVVVAVFQKVFQKVLVLVVVVGWYRVDVSVWVLVRS
jgi:hypothetical protein